MTLFRHHWNDRRYPTADGLVVTGPAPAWRTEGLVLKGNDYIDELAAHMVRMQDNGLVSGPTQYPNFNAPRLAA